MDWRFLALVLKCVFSLLIIGNNETEKDYLNLVDMDNGNHTYVMQELVQ